MAISDDLPKCILVPLDGSDFSFAAAKYAIGLARTAGSEIIFMHAVIKLPFMDVRGAAMMLPAYIADARQHAETWYKSLGDLAVKAGVKFSTETILDVVSAADSIVNYAADKKADLIVMGTKGRTGLKRFILGSVASGVVAHAKCSVLVVK